MEIIREEQSGDAKQIRVVNHRAFGQAEEADLVDRLRQTCPNSISRVAVSKGQIVGHILFTPVKLEANEKVIEGMGFAPMAVLPEFQR